MLDFDALDALRENVSHKSNSQALPGLADLLGLWTEWLALPGNFMDVVENPFPLWVAPMGMRFEARVVWRFVLKSLSSTHSEQMKRVLEIYDKWENSEPERFYQQYSVKGNAPSDEGMRSFFKDIFYETKAHFDRFHARFYQELVRTHVAINSRSLHQADENIRTGHGQSRQMITQDNGGVYYGIPLFTERAFVYVENIAEIVNAINAAILEHVTPGFPIPDIEEAWWMAMLRMQAWNMGIKLIVRKGLKVPIDYYEDPSRIYIM
jgi:hypothetical protein